MEFISSDTNIWIDFHSIGCLEVPFRLPYTFIMSSEVMEKEALGLPDLEAFGLKGVEYTIEEFFLAESYGMQYSALSIPDRIALAIAATRQITLLTGDRKLRKAAEAEGVEVHGSLWVIDELHGLSLATPTECLEMLESFTNLNGGIVRLPQSGIDELRTKISRS